MSILNKLGWNSLFEDLFLPYKERGFQTGRVSAENKNNYLIYCEYGEITAEVSGKLLFNAESAAQLPKTGDWVIISLHNNNSHAIIHEILPRQTKISRKSSDKKIEEQIMAVNIDIIFIMQSLDNNLNVNRLRRYLVAMNESKAEVIVLLSKTDLCPDADNKIAEIINAVPMHRVIAVSSFVDSGIELVKSIISEMKTAVIVGSSGVGKSTLINKVLGAELVRAGEVRSTDSKGRHTTTRRELFILPGGGMIIDTPGMRELALWNADQGFSKTFSIFDELSNDCYFSDCTHIHEIKCAVLEALKEGRITPEEYNNYIKLRKELRYLESRQNITMQLEEKRKWKSIHRQMKDFNKKNRS